MIILVRGGGGRVGGCVGVFCTSSLHRRVDDDDDVLVLAHRCGAGRSTIVQVLLIGQRYVGISGGPRRRSGGGGRESGERLRWHWRGWQQITFVIIRSSS